ncbi:MAG: hypothetical protein V3S55_15155 [Nitrospiraceae bacterium]
MLFDSAIITRGSGSVGGLTFSHGIGGNYIRARTTPVNPNTIQQQAVRGFVSQLSALWSGQLPQTDRDKWIIYAENVTLTNPLGAAINVSGMNMYVRSNVPRLQAGLPRQDTAPGIFDLGEFTNPATATFATAQQVSVIFNDSDLWVSEDDSSMLLYVSRPVGEAIEFFKGPYRFAGSIDGEVATPPTSPQLISVPFLVVAGQKVFTRIRVTRADGRLSADFREGGIVLT